MEATSDLGIAGLDGIELLDSTRSSVYRARQTVLDRLVAIKILNTHYDPILPKRFDRRRKAFTTFTNKTGIVSLYDSGETRKGKSYIVMPYFRMGSLKDLVSQGPTPWSQAVHLISQTAETMADAHAQDLVLGDLKPSSILLADSETPRISVYGMATRRFDDGDPSYAAPEANGLTQLTPAADVYSLTIILSTLILGEAPDIQIAPQDLLAKLISTIPSSVYEVIEHGSENQIENRYHNAGLLASGLRSALASETDSTLTKNPTTPTTSTTSTTSTGSHLASDSEETEEVELTTSKSTAQIKKSATQTTQQNKSDQEKVSLQEEDTDQTEDIPKVVIKPATAKPAVKTRQTITPVHGSTFDTNSAAPDSNKKETSQIPITLLENSDTEDSDVVEPTMKVDVIPDLPQGDSEEQVTSSSSKTSSIQNIATATRFVSELADDDPHEDPALSTETDPQPQFARVQRFDTRLHSPNNDSFWMSMRDSVRANQRTLSVLLAASVITIVAVTALTLKATEPSVVDSSPIDTRSTSKPDTTLEKPGTNSPVSPFEEPAQGPPEVTSTSDLDTPDSSKRKNSTRTTTNTKKTTATTAIKPTTTNQSTTATTESPPTTTEESEPASSSPVDELPPSKKPTQPKR